MLATMRTEAEGLGALYRVLDAVEDAPPTDAVEAVTRQLGIVVGATAAAFLIADSSGRALVRLTHVAAAQDADGERRWSTSRRDAEEQATVMPLDGGPAEQALRTQHVQVVPPGAGGAWTVFAPVTERGESLGLLELSLPSEPSADTVDEIARVAHVLAFVVIVNRRHTDLFEWGERSTEFTLSAEIQRRLLPTAYTCEGGAFTLSAWLEPAASVGGDTFDYSLARDVLHLSVTDAMGHGVGSALTATLCVASLRNTRRQGASLLDQVQAANTALADHVDPTDTEGFATGLLGRLDLPTGVLSLVNAGHVAPYLARDGAVGVVTLPPGMPLGLFADSEYASTPLELLPGDRLVIVTDGMLERNAAHLDLAAEIAAGSELHPREATRRLADKVLEASGGTLADDAALLVLDWHGQHGSGRRTVAGADRVRADGAAAELA